VPLGEVEHLAGDGGTPVAGDPGAAAVPSPLRIRWRSGESAEPASRSSPRRRCRRWRAEPARWRWATPREAGRSVRRTGGHRSSARSRRRRSPTR
jgi:hypothetical protein